MTLLRKLWLAIIVCMAVTFVGSLALNILSVRSYLQQELQVKNSDNAMALALSLSQLPKDLVTVELQLSAQFDAGHYRFIRIVSPTGQLLVERRFEGTLQEAPAWFTRLIPIQAHDGRALIQDGWKQYGVLSLASHEQYAYRTLWTGTLELLAWFVAGGLLTGVAGTLAMRAITRPLGDIVKQAQAITEHRFIQSSEPATPELRSVVRAMNSMVERLKTMFSEEAERLEALRRRINIDALTGLSAREHFLSQVQALTASGEVSLLMLRLNDLELLNRQLGYKRVDIMLQELATELQAYCMEIPGCKMGRLRGGDLAVAYQAGMAHGQVATELHQRLHKTWLPEWQAKSGLTAVFHMALAGHARAQQPSELLSRADEALAYAETLGPNSLYVFDGAVGQALSGDEWRRRLNKAVENRELDLTFVPVQSISAMDLEPTALLHQEAVVRWRQGDATPPLKGGDFMPMAARLQLSALMDMAVVKLALTQLRAQTGDLAINLAPQSLTDFKFRHQLMTLLKAHADLCPRLLFEVHEYGVNQHFDAFFDFAKTFKALGCRIGIANFSQSLSQGNKLADVQLDYIKVDPSYLAQLASNLGNQEYLKGLCAMSRLLGITVIAQEVESADNVQLLAELGFRGATGLATSEPSAPGR